MTLPLSECLQTFAESFFKRGAKCAIELRLQLASSVGCLACHVAQPLTCACAAIDHCNASYAK